MERPATPAVEAFFTACATGDVGELRELLARKPGLVHELHNGTTGLHVAVHHPEAVRLLLEHGADPNQRDVGDLHRMDVIGWATVFARHAGTSWI